MPLDPQGTHNGGSPTGGSSSSGVSIGPGADGGDVQSMMGGRDWVDDDLLGAVSLSLFTAGSIDPQDECGDTSIGGPAVTCEGQTLPDGTHLTVGHGTQDGAARLTVAYERPDGTLMIVTSDEASSQWWADGTGPDPLEEMPVTVGQLAELATAPGAHF
jgi:hypothetical protein